MTTKATEKIIEALTQLVEGFAELQEKLEEDYDPEVERDSGDDDSDSDEEESSSEIGEAMVTEIKAAVELLFKVEVKSVQVLNQKGKTKRFGGRIGRRDHAKKAFVALKEGQELNFSGEAA